MNARELALFTATSAVSHKLRSGLTGLGIAIGVAAVVLLTSMGEGLRTYMVAEFTQFGTNIVGINPGKAQTLGMPTGVLNSARPLGLADAQALRRVPYVRAILPLVQGSASVEGGGRERQTVITGTGDELTTALSFRVALGKFLPPDDPDAPRSFAVLGSKVRSELFDTRNPLGERIRVAVESCRIRRTDRSEFIDRATISIGVAEYRAGESLDEFIERGDRALYQSKNAGRNRVSAAR